MDVAKPKNLRCFIISPIGGAGSEDRRKADAVLSLIHEAAEAASCSRDSVLRPYRGESSTMTGQVVMQIVQSILNDPLIIGILFDDNPNVYLELGVAETLGRPVILLRDRSYTPPYDMRMFRSISYAPDLYETGVDAAAKRNLVAALSDYMDEAAIAPVCKVPFEISNISPPARTYPLDRFSYMRYPAWSSMLLDADREIWLAGTSLWELFSPKKTNFFKPVVDDVGDPSGLVEPCHILELLRVMFFRGRSINLLTMDEDSPFLAGMLGPVRDGAEAMLEEARDEIRKTHRVLNKELDSLLEPARELVRPGGVFRIVKIGNRQLTHRVTMTEKIGYVTPIFYARTDINSGPCFRVTPKSAFEARQQGGHELDSMSFYSEVLNDLRLHVAENGMREIRS